MSAPTFFNHWDEDFDAFPCVWLFDEEALPAVSQDPNERVATLRESARSPDGRVLCRCLFAVLRFEAVERRVRIESREPLGENVERHLELSVADLLFDLCSERAERRIGAIDVLYEMEAFRLQDGLVRCLDEETSGVRWLAAQALTALQARLILPDLAYMICSGDPKVRYVARCALAWLATEAEADLVIQGVWEDDACRFASLRGLRRLIALAPEQVAPKAIEPLTFLADDKRELVRAAAAEALGEIADVYPTLALRIALPVLRRRGRAVPWASRRGTTEGVARAECHIAATKIQGATRSRKSLPLPTESTFADGRNLPRASGAGAAEP